jgi:holo-[acyl-carrier protein] synthase
MIVGIGCDVIEVQRIREAIDRGGFLERVYTEAERKFCTTEQGLPKYESYAARFAAKEALVKALGTGFRQGSFQEIAVLDNSLGKPELFLSGKFAALARNREYSIFLCPLVM